MPFVNEYIPADDIEKYQIKEIDKNFIVGGTNSDQWTIDRKNGIYLRCVARGREDIRNQTIWSFYWKDNLLTLRLDLLEGRGGRGEAGWSHWKLVWLNGSNGLPEHLKAQKAQILEDLRESLTAYQGAGVYSAAYASYSITLELDKECIL